MSKLETFDSILGRSNKLAEAARRLTVASQEAAHATANDESVNDLMEESRRIHDLELMPLIADLNVQTLVHQHSQGLISDVELVAALQLR